MLLTDMLHFAFANDCTVKFSLSLNQINITVTQFEHTPLQKQVTQTLPRDNHMRPEKVKDCIMYCVNKIKDDV